MRRLLAHLLRPRPAGPGVTSDAAFLLPVGAMLSHDWLAPHAIRAACHWPEPPSTH